MRRVAIAGLAVLTACAPGQLSHRGPTPNAPIEAQYATALAHLDTARAEPALDTAITFLDAYLAYAGYVQRRPEALVLRRLASDAKQLARVLVALEEARSNTTESRSGSAATAARTEEAVKEIQRLREQLANANAELERIKKRLATPKP